MTKNLVIEPEDFKLSAIRPFKNAKATLFLRNHMATVFYVSIRIVSFQWRDGSLIESVSKSVFGSRSNSQSSLYDIIASKGFCD